MQNNQTIVWEDDAWKAVCLPKDGARLSELSYEGQPLLTPVPEDFSPPEEDFGEYELRPVYGYDDCFPTVDQCTHPQSRVVIPDHGELCWQQWQVRSNSDGLTAETRLNGYPLCFQRKMIFSSTQLTWQWRVENPGSAEYFFIHVMHPLLPLDQISHISLPPHSHVVDEEADCRFPVSGATEVADFLMRSARDRAYMLLLKDVSEGQISWRYLSGLKITSVFSTEQFPTVGIWWNPQAHPPEPGKQRNECALEPIPGAASSLDKSYRQNCCMTVPAHGELSWRVIWNLEK